MVFLPEACDFIGEKRSQFVENAELLHGKTVHSFCQKAKDKKVWLSLGGILEKVDQYVNFFWSFCFSVVPATYNCDFCTFCGCYCNGDYIYLCFLYNKVLKYHRANGLS